jgi:hypothetical protein
MNSQGNAVVNVTLWTELREAVGRHTDVPFTWVKAHSEILLNEFADMVMMRGLNGQSDGPLPVLPNNEDTDETEHVTTDEEATSNEDWLGLERPPPETFNPGTGTRDLMPEERYELVRHNWRTLGYMRTQVATHPTRETGLAPSLNPSQDLATLGPVSLANVSAPTVAEIASAASYLSDR